MRKKIYFAETIERQRLTRWKEGKKEGEKGGGGCWFCRSPECTLSPWVEKREENRKRSVEGRKHLQGKEELVFVGPNALQTSLACSNKRPRGHWSGYFQAQGHLIINLASLHADKSTELSPFPKCLPLNPHPSTLLRCFFLSLVNQWRFDLER